VEKVPKKAKGKDNEVDVLDTMITALVELLGEKGVITQEEWEQRIKKNLKSQDNG
jgi:hypothetical protein